MINAKEKAEELFKNFYNKIEGSSPRNCKREAIYYAMLCCNGVLNYVGTDKSIEFWRSVKDELNKM